MVTVTARSGVKKSFSHLFSVCCVSVILMMKENYVWIESLSVCYTIFLMEACALTMFQFVLGFKLEALADKRAKQKNKR